MNIDSIISEKISEYISIALEAQIKELERLMSNCVSKAEFEKWGRYLTPKQAMVYTGYKSVNGFKELCRLKGIKPTKVNDRVIRYDRYELDKINVQVALKDYIKTLKYTHEQ